jgi:ATP-binding cassette, subfamily C, bacterial
MPQSASPPDPPHPGSTWRTALRLVRFAISVDPRAFALTVAISLVGSLAEGAGIVLLLPMLSAAGMNFGASSAAGRLGAESQHLLLHAGVPHSLWLPAVLGAFLITGALRSLLRRSQSMMNYATTTRVQLALSRRLYESVVKAQWGYLVRQRSGHFTHLLTEELRQVTDAISLSLSLINLACLTLLYLVVALKLSAPMTLLVLAMGGLLMLLQRRSLSRTRASGKAYSRSVGEVFAATEEHLLNLKSVKTYDAEDRDVQMFDDLCREVARHSVRTAKHQAASSFRFEVGSLIALGSVIFLALGVIHVQPATMLLLLAIFTRLMPQLATLQSQTHQYASILPSFDHILSIEADCLAHAEPAPPDNAPETPRPAAGALNAAAINTTPATRLTLHRELRLEDIWFAYQTPPSSQPSGPTPSNATNEAAYVLRGIDLPIQAGILTAITGPSGAGKSTIADLINGLLLPTRGRLVLDGQPLGPAEIRQWRRQVGYVGQETVLFHQSVRKNLLWARPDATDDDLRQALTLASASFVFDLPGGLESIVGDRGILLSSGQRQRISLARALLRNPTLLILDEATNALDVENEARILDAIREAMNNLHGTLTILMIAHRASAIRRADRIFELDAGRITHSGAWAELNPMSS